MNHLGTQKLETERLILRKFTLDDSGAMYRNWASDPEVTKYLTWPTHESENISKEVLKDWTSSYVQKDYYQWAIVLKAESKEPIGSIAVVHKNDNIQMVHLGYCIGQKWWHKGITSEALNAVIDFLFNEVGVNRIEAMHDSNNPNSGKVMKKCGMIYEGTLRQAGRNNEGLCDVCCYAILKSDR